MKRALSQPLLHFKEYDCKKERGGNIVKNREGEGEEEEEDEGDVITEQIQCITLHKKRPQPFIRGEELSLVKYGLWRQKQKSGAARLEKQMKARWTLEDLIEEQLNRFQAHYNRAVVPTHLKDVSKLLMPKWAPPHELAAMAWLGDWRPSALLGLLSSLTRSSSSLLDSIGVEQALSQLIHDIRIEEAIIDEEMAEIQANCILHLSFGSVNKLSTVPALACIQSEFTKIHRVIVKAQSLRFKALELIVKKVLSQTDAVEFLVAFAGIQDSIHQIARKLKMLKGGITNVLEPYKYGQVDLSQEKLSLKHMYSNTADCLEMHVGAVHSGERVLVIDDLVATGGTLSAAIRLLVLRRATNMVVDIIN